MGLLSARQQRKAAEEARRQEFLAGVGGIDLLAHTFTPRAQERMHGAPLEIARRQAKQLADLCLAGWINEEQAQGQTPQEYADRRFEAVFAQVDALPLMRAATWYEERKRKRA